MSRPSAGSGHLAQAALLFSALGDERRLALVNRLSAEGPQSITRLTTGTGSAITRQAITKHLQVLVEAGLVHDSRRGRERIWTLDAHQLDEASLYLDQIAQRWEEAIERLRQFVERSE
jgi:DNA-binding transcriptional ArsR family regulator